MTGNTVANPNLEILSFQSLSVAAAPLTFFRYSLVGWQNAGPSILLQLNFNSAGRVAMQMPYDGFLHQWSVKHGNYPNQQGGQWKWVLGHNFQEADSFIDVANPTNPFNPGPGVHEQQVFSKVPGETDQPFPFQEGDLIWFGLGALKGIFTITRDGLVSCSVTVMLEFFRP